MKRKQITTSILAFILLASVLTQCKKTNEPDAPACKTCTAYAPSTPSISAEVCTTKAEQDFRSQYAGREISCR